MRNFLTEDHNSCSQEEEPLMDPFEEQPTSGHKTARVNSIQKMKAEDAILERYKEMQAGLSQEEVREDMILTL